MKLSEFVDKLIDIKNKNPNHDPDVVVDSGKDIWSGAKISQLNFASASQPSIAVIIYSD